MTDISIRRASLHDTATLLEFEQHIIAAERSFDSCLKDDPISYYDLKALVLSDSAQVLLAEIDGKIVGSGYAQLRDSRSFLQHDRHAYLGFMYVDPRYRGIGVIECVINALKQWSKSQQVSHFSLEVYADNQRAIRAYEKSGFKKFIVEMSLSDEKREAE